MKAIMRLKDRMKSRNSSILKIIKEKREKEKEGTLEKIS